MRKVLISFMFILWAVSSASSASAMIFCVPGGNNPDPACEGPNPPAHCGEYDPTYGGGRLIAIIKEAVAELGLSAKAIMPSKVLAFGGMKHVYTD